MERKIKNKLLKGLVSIVFLSLLFFALSTVATVFAQPVASDNFVLSGEISEYYGYLSTVDLPTATYSGNAAAGKVIAPDGTEDGITGYCITQFGTHTVRYTYTDSTNEYYTDYTFGVKRLPINVVADGETDSFTSYCSEYPIPSLVNKESDNVTENALYLAGSGIAVHLKSGEYAESTELDMSGSVGYESDQDRQSKGVPHMAEEEIYTPVFAFAFMPQDVKQGKDDDKYDAKTTMIDFIDSNGNVFTISLIIAWGGDCYVVGYYNGEQLNQTYIWINLHPLGYNSEVFGVHILIGRIYYDAEAKAFVIANGGKNCSGFFGTFTEFDDTNVKVKIRFGNYVKESAGLFVFNLNGMTGTDLFSVNDTEPPVINIDYGGYLKDSLPVYSTGERFGLFTADVFDEYTLSRDYTVKVFYGDDEIATENGGFTPSVGGTYTLVYSAEDVFGNSAEERVNITVGVFISETDITDLTLSYGDKNGLTYGDTLKSVAISGGKAFLDGSEVAGRFAFVDEDFMPLPTSSGKSVVYITFLSDARGYFLEKPVAIEVYVDKFTPQVKDEVTAKRTVNSAAELADPKGEFFNENGGVLRGSLVWENKELISGENTLTWVFIPYNTDLYETVSGTISVTLNGSGGGGETETPEKTGGCGGNVGAGNTFIVTLALLTFSVLITVKRQKNTSRGEK